MGWQWQEQLLKETAVTTTSPFENEPGSTRLYSNEQNLEKCGFLCALIQFSNVDDFNLCLQNLCSSNTHMHTHTPAAQVQPCVHQEDKSDLQ